MKMASTCRRTSKPSGWVTSPSTRTPKPGPAKACLSWWVPSSFLVDPYQSSTRAYKDNSHRPCLVVHARGHQNSELMLHFKAQTGPADCCSNGSKSLAVYAREKLSPRLDFRRKNVECDQLATWKRMPAKEWLWRIHGRQSSESSHFILQGAHQQLTDGDAANALDTSCIHTV